MKGKSTETVAQVSKSVDISVDGSFWLIEGVESCCSASMVMSSSSQECQASFRARFVRMGTPPQFSRHGTQKREHECGRSESEASKNQSEDHAKHKCTKRAKLALREFKGYERILLARMSTDDDAMTLAED